MLDCNDDRDDIGSLWTTTVPIETVNEGVYHRGRCIDVSPWLLQIKILYANVWNRNSGLLCALQTGPTWICVLEGHYFWMGSCGSCNEMTKRVVRYYFQRNYILC